MKEDAGDVASNNNFSQKHISDRNQQEKENAATEQRVQSRGRNVEKSSSRLEMQDDAKNK